MRLVDSVSRTVEKVGKGPCVCVCGQVRSPSFLSANPALNQSRIIGVFTCVDDRLILAAPGASAV